MSLSKQKVTALLMGLGAVLFLVAAFLPVSRVFGEPLPERKIEIIASLPQMWNLGQVLFALGALITTLSFGLLSFQMKNVPGSQWVLLAVILMVVGSVFWSWHLAERIINPHMFAYGQLTPYLFIVYSLLTQFGLLLTGIFFLRAGISRSLGLMFIISACLFFVLMLVFKDMPPFVYYIITGTASIMLYSKRNGINIKHFQ